MSLNQVKSYKKLEADPSFSQLTNALMSMKTSILGQFIVYLNEMSVKLGRKQSHQRVYVQIYSGPDALIPNSNVILKGLCRTIIGIEHGLRLSKKNYSRC